MGAKTGPEMAERIKDAARGRAHQPLANPKLFFQGAIWPARLAVMVGSLVIAFLLGALFVSYGSKLYEDWTQNRLLHRATELLQEGKLSEASRTAQELLGRHLDSLPALYILAEAAEKQNLEEAVWRREQIARLLPKDADSQLNLASAALRFGKLDLAREALDRVAPNDRDRAAFHVVAGWLARAEGNLAEQEEEFAAAVKKDPGNDLYQFNLAALQIHSSDAAKNAKAGDILQRLSKMASYRTGALRALLNDAVARNDLGAADNFAQQLQMSPEVTFADYLLCLNFYRKLDERKFRPLLEKVKPFASRNSSDLASLMDWMNRNGLAADVVKWIDKLAAASPSGGGLPAAQLSSPPTSVAVADAYATVKNWSRLKRWTRTSATGGWGDSEYVRLAYQAIATRQSQSRSNGAANTEFETLWRSAEQLTNEQPAHALALARLASKWELEKESEELWQRVAENPPMRREALEALRRLYRAKNETGKLYDVLQRLHETSPNEAPITADLARLGLDLEQNIERSNQLAREAYDRAPDEVNCAVTYAFSLSRLGRNSEGLAIIQNLPPDQLHDQHAAVYVALLQAEASQLGGAQEYIEAAENGEIYPEEKKLLDQAKTKLAAASATPSPALSSTAELSPTPTASRR
jgi:lipopolysaccharide biosynthesis regulator YciM